MITSFSSFIPDGLSACKKKQKLGNTFTGWNAYRSNLKGVGKPQGLISSRDVVENTVKKFGQTKF